MTAFKPLATPIADAGWPDGVDLFSMAVVGAVLLGAPALGYVFMALDIRAYYRSLRRALTVVRGYMTTLPEWVRRDNPPCMQALGLSLPCTEAEVLAAYRQRVKDVHPDRGGSQEQFARLQRHFEQAMSLVAAGD